MTVTGKLLSINMYHLLDAKNNNATIYQAIMSMRAESLINVLIAKTGFVDKGLTKSLLLIIFLKSCIRIPQMIVFTDLFQRGLS